MKFASTVNKFFKPVLYLTAAIAVHLIFSISILDIYFKSTVIHGMTPHKNPLPPPAKRLVLIVIDGLRVDTFYNVINKDENNAYLRYIIENEGVSGISHCQVPTESRTGHVALIAGMTEDVSAVLTGWQHNPVDFDSVFNESRYTWSWGSPDILSIFSKNTHRNHMYCDSYDSNELDFASLDFSYGDTWVFNKVKNFFESAPLNETQSEMLRQDKIVFFLHLIATDNLGHGKKPGSMEYKENIVYADKKIRETVGLIEDYYNNDGRTVYIVTADHGMTDHGSHGSGSVDETETPIVVWGAGIRGPNTLKVYDIQQVDVSALMASLIGISFPMNSVGVLPINYLNVSNEFHANSLLSNAKQIVELSTANRELKRNTALTFFFQDFKFTYQMTLQLINRVEHLIAKREYSEAILVTKDLIHKSLDAIRYYETYDRTVLNITISIAFLLWMVYLISFILEKYTFVWHVSVITESHKKRVKSSRKFLIPYVIATASIIYLLKARNASLQYYAYFILPLILLKVVHQRLHYIKTAIQFAKEQSLLKSMFFGVITMLVVLDVFISSFFNRSVLTLGLLGLSTWPWFSILKHKSKGLCRWWTFTVICLSFFPLLPVVGKTSNYSLVYFSSFLSLVLIIYFSLRPEIRVYFTSTYSSDNLLKAEFILLSQVFLVSMSLLIKYNTVTSIAQNRGLLLHNQILAWTILGFSIILPFLSSTKLLPRLFHVFVSVLPVYIMMSTAYEVLFLLLLSCICLVWILCEHQLSKTANIKIENINSLISNSDSILTSEDVRRAYFYLFFIFTAFFGTGNIASLSSFDTASLFCFITVFHPFAMALLILLKVLIPFIVVACTFFSIIVIVRIQVWSLFALVLFMSDFMSLHMFLVVQDFGSWLEIGSSISRYILMIMITIFLLLLYFFSQTLMTKTLSPKVLSKIRQS